jgi:hypothetical protein
METTENKVSQLQWFVRENIWIDRGIIDFGWGNGYVCIPEGHPCYRMDYDAIHDQFDISVHGGLTFSDPSSELKWGEIPEGEWWIVGFDTAHYGDSIGMWPKVMVEMETKNLMRQLDEIKVPS